jgi:hypothetical protein
MEGRSNSAEFRVILVGAKSDQFVRFAAALSNRLAVNFAVCRDIYEVAAELARCPAERGLVIGRLEQLSREKGRLLEKGAQAGWVCCCIAKKISGSARNQAIRAMQSGAIVVKDASQLEEVIVRVMNDTSGTLPGTGQETWAKENGR